MRRIILALMLALVMAAITGGTAFTGFASAKPANARSHKAITAASVIVKTVCLVKVLPGLVLRNVTNGIDPASFPGRLPTARPSLSTVAICLECECRASPRWGISRNISSTFSELRLAELRLIAQLGSWPVGFCIVLTYLWAYPVTVANLLPWVAATAERLV